MVIDLPTSGYLQLMTQKYYIHRVMISYFIGIFAVVILFPGIILVIMGDYDGLVLIGIWITLFTYRSGIQINYQKKEISNFKEYLWMKFHSPKNIKDFAGYRMKRASYSYNSITRVKSIDYSGDLHSIELFNSISEKYELIAVNNLKTTISIIYFIENELGIQKMRRKIPSNSQD